MSLGLSMRIGWRTLRRQRRRSIITSATIVFSLALMLFFVAWMDGAHGSYIEAGVRLGSGHVVVQGEGYQDNQTLDYLISNPESVAGAAREIAGVKAVGIRLAGAALISAGENSSAIVFVGVTPRDERNLSDMPKKLISGRYLQERSGARSSRLPEIFIGTTLADNLQVRVSDRVVLKVAGGETSASRSMAFLVAGIFRSAVGELDSHHGQITLKAARDLLGRGPVATQVALLIDDHRRSRLVATQLATNLKNATSNEGGEEPRLEILPWEIALSSLYDGLLLDRASGYIMLGTIVIIIVIGVFNTMLMSVIERTRQFGVMMALGTSRGRVFSFVMAEAIFLAAISVAVGLALGIGISEFCGVYGIDLSSFGADLEFGGVVASGTLYARLATESIVRWGAAMFLMVILAALYPAYRATRLMPVEAMKHI